MKLNRTVVASVAAVALIGGLAACKPDTPSVGNPVVVVHPTHVHVVVHPAPVHTVIHVYQKPTTKVVIHKH